MGLLDFVGNAAVTANGMYERQNKADEAAKIQADRDAAQEESNKRIAQHSSDLALSRTKALEEFKQQQVIAEEARKRDPANLQAEADAEGKKYDLGADLRAKKTAETDTNWLTNYRMKSSAELEAEVTKLKDPGLISGTKAFKDATRDTSGDALRSVQLEAAQLALSENKAMAKMPVADRNYAASLQKQIESVGKTRDTLVGAGTGTTEGLAELGKKEADLNAKLAEVYKPFMAPRSPAPKPVATYDNVAAYAKAANMSFDKALEIAGKTYDVSGVKVPGQKPAGAGGLINQSGGSEQPKQESPKPARDFYSDPARQKYSTQIKPASTADIASAQQEVNTLQARYEAVPAGGKGVAGGTAVTNAARIQIANALASAKDKLQELINQGK